MRYRRGAGLVATVMLVLASFVVVAPAQAAPSTTDYEGQIAAHINKARADAGLRPVTVSASMSSVARAWSGTMASTASFKHNPSYSTQLPGGWTSLGENVAWGMQHPGTYPAAKIHENLMNSPGHRANILGAKYTHVGIGVSFVTRKGALYVYVTQNFGQYPSGVAVDGPKVSANVPFGQIVLSPDANGDGLGDVYTVDSAGRLFFYRGAGGTLGASTAFGTGWGSLKLYAPGDFNGDGRADLLATDSKGDLWLYPGKGNGSLGSRTQVGFGWNGFRIIPTGDMNGDRIADILAIDRAGNLYLYPGAGKGRFGKAAKVGNGWGSFQLYAAGDMTADRRGDIFGIDSTGRLYLYAGLGGGTFAKRTQVGQGWRGFSFSSGGDLNGDGINDLLGKDSKRNLWFYAGRPGGAFHKPVHIASGW